MTSVITFKSPRLNLWHRPSMTLHTQFSLGHRSKAKIHKINPRKRTRDHWSSNLQWHTIPSGNHVSTQWTYHIHKRRISTSWWWPWLSNTIEGVKRDDVVRVWIKRCNGMNDLVDKSRGLVTLMDEALANINPIEPLRLAKQAARLKPNCWIAHWADSSKHFSFFLMKPS